MLISGAGTGELTSVAIGEGIEEISAAKEIVCRYRNREQASKVTARCHNRYPGKNLPVAFAVIGDQSISQLAAGQPCVTVQWITEPRLRRFAQGRRTGLTAPERNATLRSWRATIGTSNICQTDLPTPTSRQRRCSARELPLPKSRSKAKAEPGKRRCDRVGAAPW